MNAGRNRTFATILVVLTLCAASFALGQASLPKPKPANAAQDLSDGLPGQPMGERPVIDHIEIPKNWVPDIAAAKRRATQLGHGCFIMYMTPSQIRAYQEKFGVATNSTTVDASGSGATTLIGSADWMLNLHYFSESPVASSTLTSAGMAPIPLAGGGDLSSLKAKRPATTIIGFDLGPLEVQRYADGSSDCSPSTLNYRRSLVASLTAEAGFWEMYQTVVGSMVLHRNINDDYVKWLFMQANLSLSAATMPTEQSLVLTTDKKGRITGFGTTSSTVSGNRNNQLLLGPRFAGPMTQRTLSLRDDTTYVQGTPWANAIVRACQTIGEYMSPTDSRVNPQHHLLAQGNLMVDKDFLDYVPGLYYVLDSTNHVAGFDVGYLRVRSKADCWGGINPQIHINRRSTEQIVQGIIGRNVLGMKADAARQVVWTSGYMYVAVTVAANEVARFQAVSSALSGAMNQQLLLIEGGGGTVVEYDLVELGKLPYMTY